MKRMLCKQGGGWLVLAALAFAATAHGADDDVTDTIMRISEQRMHVGARTPRRTAMGGGGVALSGSVDPVVANPAGLGNSLTPEARIIYEHNGIDGHDFQTELDASDSSPGVLVVVPVGGETYEGTLGMGFVRHDIDIAEWDHTEIRSNEFHMGWGAALAEGIDWGASYTYRTQDTDAGGGVLRESDMHTFRGGLRWQLAPNLAAGADAFLSMGHWDGCYTSIPDDEGDLMNVGLEAGLAWEVRPTVTAVGDVRYRYLTNDDDHVPEEEELSLLSMHLGVEKRFYFCSAQEGGWDKELALRAGYHVTGKDWDVQMPPLRGDDDIVHGGTVGVGFRARNIYSDYTFELREYGDTAHLMNVGATF